MRLFIWYIYIGDGPGGVFNFTVSNSGEGDIKKTDFGFGLRAPTTPWTIEKSQKFDYKKLSLISIID